MKLYEVSGIGSLPGGFAGYMTTSSLPLEETMATHSSTLAWKIPWMEEPGGL